MVWYIDENAQALQQTIYELEAGKKGLRAFIYSALKDETDSDEFYTL